MFTLKKIVPISYGLFEMVSWSFNFICICLVQGFRVITWADVNIDNTTELEDDPVVFVGRQGKSGVVSWNIPLQPEG